MEMKAKYTKTKYMDIKEFRDLGLLQEINRKFLHPMGLALAVEIDDNHNHTLAGIIDYREDPKGVIYEKKALENKDSIEKMENVEQLFYSKLKTRLKNLGFFIQPVYQFKNYKYYLHELNEKDKINEI